MIKTMILVLAISAFPASKHSNFIGKKCLYVDSIVNSSLLCAANLDSIITTQDEYFLLSRTRLDSLCKLDIVKGFKIFVDGKNKPIKIIKPNPNYSLFDDSLFNENLADINKIKLIIKYRPIATLILPFTFALTGALLASIYNGAYNFISDRNLNKKTVGFMIGILAATGFTLSFVPNEQPIYFKKPKSFFG